MTAEEGPGRNMGSLNRGLSVPVQCLVAQPRGERRLTYKRRAPIAKGRRIARKGASGPLAILVRSCRLGSRTAPQFQLSLVNFGSKVGTKIPVPCCGIRGTTWEERAIEDLASRRLVV